MNEQLSIKECYDTLLSYELSFSLIDMINSLKDRCIKENNKEYLYKCNLLISDVYIERDTTEEALNLLLKDIKNIDPSIFKNIYLSYLDRLVYLYVNKRNYNVAIRYASLKETLLNKTDKESINRLYMEMSYIYAGMGELDKAEFYLKEIINNEPDNETESYVLSNLTKIYIDKSDIQMAKETLNSCLCIETDHNGDIYNEYLLAKICVLEEKYAQALQLYEEIFEKEEINNMTLSIFNDYLSLLIKLEMYDNSLLLMNKLSLFINATNDLEIKKQFYTNKLNYFAGIKDNNNVSITMKEINDLDKTLALNEQKILKSNFEEEKLNIVEETTSSVMSKIDVLTNLTSIALKGSTLRDIIMDYSTKINKIIPFSNLTVVLFNKVDEHEYEITDNIKLFRYKNNRLYEKSIEYKDLMNTIVEMMVTKNRPIALDLASSNFKLDDIFTNTSYDNNETRYLNAIPCVYKDDVFACVVYQSFNDDITNQENNVLLKVSTMSLESALTIMFLNDNYKASESICDFVIKESNLGLFYLNNNTMYLSNYLKQMLKIKYNSVSKNDFMKKICKSDLEKYQTITDITDGYSITYKYELGTKIIELEEVVHPYKDLNGKILYYQGIIKSLENKNIGYALSKKELDRYMLELKRKTDAIEFRFSLIKIKGSSDEYLDIKASFGVEPYYLVDGSFIIILENEVNQRTLDKLIKNYVSRTAVVRYPRDVINIDEMLNIASLMIEQSIVYFNQEVYRGFIKKNNLITRITSVLSNPLKLRKLIYKSFNGNNFYEIKPAIIGLSEKERICKYLGEEISDTYNEKLFNAVVDANIPTSKNDRIIIELTNKGILSAINNYDINKYNYISFIMGEFNDYSKKVFELLKQNNLKIYIDYSLIEMLDAYIFTSGIIKGIYISNEIGIISKNLYNKILRVANMFDLSIVSYDIITDYDKVICYTKEMENI